MFKLSHAQRLQHLRRSWFARFMVALLPCMSLVTCEAMHAQTQDVMDMGPEELKNVQVYSASMHLQSDREAPSAVTVITGGQIRQFGYRTLADVLRSVQGFSVTYDRNYTYLGVRGFAYPGGFNDQILLLINGSRVNDNVYESAQIGTEFPLDIDLIERIEIVRGPSSSLYGASAFLAVINVITKKVQSASGVQLSGSAGGFGSYAGRSTVAGTYHGVEGMFSGSIHDSAGAPRLFFPAFNSPATNYGVAQDADRDSSKSFFAMLHFRNWTLEGLGSTRKKGIPTASFAQVFNDNRSQTIDSIGHLELQYERAILLGAELTATVYFDRALYHGVYVYPPVSGQLTDVLNEDASRGDRLGFDARVSKTVKKKHKVTGGWGFRDNLRQGQTNYNLNPFQPVLDDRRSSKDWAVYGQDEFTLAKSLILNAGLRYDHYDTFGGTTNPRVALIYNPRRQTAFKLIYGQAFLPPNAYALYYGDQVSSEPNPKLRPETIKTEELIWEQNIGADFRVSTSVFGNQFAHLIEQDTDPQTGLIVFENARGTTSSGAEVELSGSKDA